MCSTTQSEAPNRYRLLERGVQGEYGRFADEQHRSFQEDKALRLAEDKALLRLSEDKQCWVSDDKENNVNNNANNGINAAQEPMRNSIVLLSRTLGGGGAEEHIERSV